VSELKLRLAASQQAIKRARAVIDFHLVIVQVNIAEKQ